MRKKYHFKKKIPNNITKIVFIIFIIFLLPIIFWASQYPQLISSEGKMNKGKVSYLASSSNSYGTIDPIDRYPANDPPPENHPDINLTVRGYVSTTGEKYPIVLGEAGDPKAPQIWKILPSRPTIVSLYRINSWDWTTNKKGPSMPLPDDPAASVKRVQMIGLATSAGEEISVPDSGYRIGGNYQVMVIFANDNSITIKYGREDNIGIKFGYAIQIEEIAVDPNLLAQYRELNAAGRGELPALSGGQVLGTAKNTEIRVVIRDTGDFLDPRSKLDWWQGVDYPPVPTDIVQNPIPTQIVVTKITTAPPQPTSQPTLNLSQPTLPPQPSTILPSTSVITNPQPTRSQPTIIIVPPTIPTITPTPKPPILSKLKSNFDDFIISLIKFTRTILP